MDEFFQKLSNVVSSLKKHLWPTFSAENIPEKVEKMLPQLPSTTQDVFFLEYEKKMRKFRQRRNFSIFLLGLSVLNQWIMVPLGVFFYWWYTKEYALPQSAEDALNKATSRQKALGGLSGYSKQNNKITMPPAYSAPGNRRPRRINIPFDPSNLTLQNLNVGYMLDYDLKTWQVVSHYQFDWDNGFSEREFKLASDIESVFLHLKNEDRHELVTLTKPINIYAIDEALDNEIIRNHRPFNILSFQGKDYFRENTKEGVVFNMEEKSSGKMVIVWEYFDESRKSFLRIEYLERRQFKAVQGKVVSYYEFSSILPSNTTDV